MIKNQVKIKDADMGFFRFKKLGDQILLTNDLGEFCFLSAPDFRTFTEGDGQKLKETNSYQYQRMVEMGLFQSLTDLDSFTAKFRGKNSFLGQGPSLHIMVLTLRCDHQCIYCQANAGFADAKGLDMNGEVAQTTVDRILESPNHNLTIEFQGGEPLLNFETLKFVVGYAKKANQEKRKNLSFSMVSNLYSMTDEKLDFLIENNVAICASLDGPELVHNHNRASAKGNVGVHATVVKWIKKIQKKYAEDGNRFRLNALLTVTALSLKHPKAIVDEYLRLGFDGIHLRPMNTFTVGKRRLSSYSVRDFLTFYKKAFEYILEKNKNGKVFYERTALLFLAKMLTDSDPNFMDLRSPCGAGTGQLAYDYDGDVFTCDEGRMLSRIGDDSFSVGNVFKNSYEEISAHPTIKALCVASCLDNLPGCEQCVYKPYCGNCPLLNYAQGGSIFLQHHQDQKCVFNQAIMDLLFEKMRDEKQKNIFESWIEYFQKRPS